jgi:hypothetical protein
VHNVNDSLDIKKVTDIKLVWDGAEPAVVDAGVIALS